MAKKKQPQPQQSYNTAIYARYSSSLQNDASIEQQYAECEEYAATHNLVIVAKYEDRAISGKRDNRPGLQKMLRAAERGEFQVLLAYKTNRISRNMMNALKYEDRLEKAGVRVVYCKEEFGDNATGRFMLRTMMNMNQFYSENMAEDIKRGLRDNAKKCLVISNAPYGYRKGEDGRFALDEKAAPVVAEIFNRFLAGETFASIARDLNRRCIPTKTGKQWSKSSFESIMHNERYTGTYIYEDIRIEGGMPTIIDRSVFEMAQRNFEDFRALHARQHEDNNFILTGKLFCGYCCAPMVGYSGTSRNGSKYYYYVCQTRHTTKGCDKANIRKELLEAEVVKAVQSAVLTDEMVDWIVTNMVEFLKKRNTKSKKADYEKQLAQTQKQIGNVVHAIEMGMLSDDLKARMATLEDEKKKLQGLIAIEKANTREIDENRIYVFMEYIRNGDYKDEAFQEMVIRNYVQAIYLFKDHFKLAVNFTGDKRMFDIPLQNKESESEDSDSGDPVRTGREWPTTAIRRQSGFPCFAV